MGGFKKNRNFSSEVTDRQVAPAKMFHNPRSDSKTIESSSEVEPLFSPEKVALFEIRFEENYDLNDPDYVAWRRIFHPEFDSSAGFSDGSSQSSGKLSEFTKGSDASCKSADVLSTLSDA